MDDRGVNVNQERLRRAVAQDLLSGKIKLLIGWEKGHYWWQSRPLFARGAEELKRLAWDSFCAVNLARYLLDELPKLAEGEKVGLLVKGCDARALNRLVQDRMVDRGRVIAYGLPCPGMLDWRLLLQAAGGRPEGMAWQDGQLLLRCAGGEKLLPGEELELEKCRSCTRPDPVAYDQLLAPPAGRREAPGRYQAVSERERSSPDERFAYWSEQLARCLRCYACRQVCPYCSCRECFVEQERPRWLGKASEPSENLTFHLIRAYHGAGRCVECGECRRACPVGIPLMELNRKLIKDISELYGPYEAGLDPEQEAPLLTYRPGDPAAFSEK